MRRMLATGSAVVVVVVVLGLLAGCSDDGAGVRSGSTSTSGSGSGSLAEQDVSGPAKNKQLQAAVASYRSYVLNQVTGLRTATTDFTNAVRAGDLASAKELYAPSRVNWEGIEPAARLVPTITASVDSQVDNFTGPDDPKFTGWHRLEYLLWVQNTTAGAARFATKLDTDLATLARMLTKVQITPKTMVLGAGDLVEAVSKRMISGTEDRYSHTDLWDFAASIAGSQAAFRAFTPLLQAKSNKALYDTLQHDFQAVSTSLAKYAVAGGGYRPYGALTAADKATMRARLATLAKDLATVSPALGIS